MLGPRIGSFVGFQTGNWMPKTNLVGKKQTNLAGELLNLAGRKIWHPKKKLIWRAPTKLRVYRKLIPDCSW